MRFFSPDIELTRRTDGSLLMRSAEPLGNYDPRVGDWLDRWAREAPDRTFIIEQTPAGERSIAYGEARESVLLLAKGLLSYGLGPERPLAILAENGIDHALIMLAAVYVGIPIAPIAPAYALQSIDYAKLSYAFELLTPGMVVVDDALLYRQPMEHALKADIPLIALRNASASPKWRDLASLKANGSHHDEVQAAAARVGRETIAKFLFTSGSTGMPKVVINTHGMICCNSQMQRQVAPCLEEEPPVMVDWAPWNHTAGSNSNFSIILHNGGTLYIDPGKPTPAKFAASLELLRRVSPTIYFNVPARLRAVATAPRGRSQISRAFFSTAEVSLVCSGFDAARDLVRSRTACRGDDWAQDSNSERPGHDRDRTRRALRQRESQRPWGSWHTGRGRRTQAHPGRQ